MGVADDVPSFFYSEPARPTLDEFRARLRSGSAMGATLIGMNGSGERATGCNLMPRRVLPRFKTTLRRQNRQLTGDGSACTLESAHLYD